MSFVCPLWLIFSPQRAQWLHNEYKVLTNSPFSHRGYVPDWRGYGNRFGKYRTFDKLLSVVRRVGIGSRIGTKISASAVLSIFLLYLPLSFLATISLCADTSIYGTSRIIGLVHTQFRSIIMGGRRCVKPPIIGKKCFLCP